MPSNNLNSVVAVTGATGFVGRALVCQILAKGREVRALTRQPPPEHKNDRLTWCQVSGLDGDLPLVGCSVVVHLAARVHVMQERSANPLAEFRRINVAVTESLARRAAASGVRRFIYLSSIKVNGEATSPGRPFRFDDPPAPEDAYGVSKCEAESVLHQVAAETGMEVVIIRPPLVYGPGVQGNFQVMLGWLRRGVPLPLGAINNRRSLVGIDNLCDLICVCLDHPAAANEVFLISDGRDLSTTDLLRLTGEAMGHPARLFPVPAPMLTILATLLGKASVARRLCGSLQADIGRTEQLLGWKPPVSVETALQRMFRFGESE